MTGYHLVLCAHVYYRLITVHGPSEFTGEVIWPTVFSSGTCSEPESPANAHLEVQTDAELVVYLYLTVKDSLHDNSRICQILLS